MKSRLWKQISQEYYNFTYTTDVYSCSRNSLKWMSVVSWWQAPSILWFLPSLKVSLTSSSRCASRRRRSFFFLTLFFIMEYFKHTKKEGDTKIHPQYSPFSFNNNGFRAMLVSLVQIFGTSILHRWCFDYWWLCKGLYVVMFCLFLLIC